MWQSSCCDLLTSVAVKKQKPDFVASTKAFLLKKDALKRIFVFFYEEYLKWCHLIGAPHEKIS